MTEQMCIREGDVETIQFVIDKQIDELKQSIADDEDYNEMVPDAREELIKKLEGTKMRISIIERRMDETDEFQVCFEL